jgi:single-strand selective monofunctional uracil DNA glycosylase
MSLVPVSRRLSARVEKLRFSLPVTHVYNPLRYARRPHELYLERYGTGRKRVVFLGMNPGPFGMAQTGVPFGEVAAVRDWLRIDAAVDHPSSEHEKRPVLGFDCQRSEVSGRRLWGFFRERFGSADRFFREHFVANYCPLAFMEGSGKNRTPDKLPEAERSALYAACDDALRELCASLEPELVVGVGAFAEKRAASALAGLGVRVGTVLHPSPASPRANRGWAGIATEQLAALGFSV